jgi:hypothetical protein
MLAQVPQLKAHLYRHLIWKALTGAADVQPETETRTFQNVDPIPRPQLQIPAIEMPHLPPACAIHEKNCRQENTSRVEHVVREFSVILPSFML